MRPVHEVLEQVWTHLYTGPGTRGATRICHALEDAFDAEKITGRELETARDYVMAAVAELAGDDGCSYLLSAAIRRGHVPIYTPVRDPGYITYRDKWLRELINNLKEKELIESERSRYARPAD